MEQQGSGRQKRAKLPADTKQRLRQEAQRCHLEDGRQGNLDSRFQNPKGQEGDGSKTDPKPIPGFHFNPPCFHAGDPLAPRAGAFAQTRRMAASLSTDGWLELFAPRKTNSQRKAPRLRTAAQVLTGLELHVAGTMQLPEKQLGLQRGKRGELQDGLHIRNPIDSSQEKTLLRTETKLRELFHPAA